MEVLCVILFALIIGWIVVDIYTAIKIEIERKHKESSYISFVTEFWKRRNEEQSWKQY